MRPSKTNETESHGLIISYNPDDNRLYIGTKEEPAIGLTTFAADPKGFANAIQWCRRREHASQ